MFSKGEPEHVSAHCFHLLSSNSRGVEVVGGVVMCVVGHWCEVWD